MCDSLSTQPRMRVMMSLVMCDLIECLVMCDSLSTQSCMAVRIYNVFCNVGQSGCVQSCVTVICVQSCVTVCTRPKVSV